MHKTLIWSDYNFKGFLLAGCFGTMYLQVFKGEKITTFMRTLYFPIYYYWLSSNSMHRLKSIAGNLAVSPNLFSGRMQY